MKLFNKERRERRAKIKAGFEARGFIMETRLGAILRWFREKWARFGSI